MSALELDVGLGGEGLEQLAVDQRHGDGAADAVVGEVRFDAFACGVPVRHHRAAGDVTDVLVALEYLVTRAGDAATGKSSSKERRLPRNSFIPSPTHASSWATSTVPPTTLGGPFPPPLHAVTASRAKTAGSRVSRPDEIG